MLFENSYAQTFWDVLLFAEHNEVKANRVGALVINHKRRSVVTLEMSCPWEPKQEGRGKGVKVWPNEMGT